MSVLVIHEVGLDDAGIYTCCVANIHGEEKCRAEVTVGDVRAHFLTSFAEHTNLTEHQNLELECELSDGEAVIQWLKNGVPIHESGKVEMYRSGPLRRLVVKDVMQQDSGEYMCQTTDERSYTRTRFVT
jgi:hypothetical protein